MKIAFKYVNDWGCFEAWLLAALTVASLWRGNDLRAAIFLTGLIVLCGVRKLLREDTP